MTDENNAVRADQVYRNLGTNQWFKVAGREWVEGVKDKVYSGGVPHSGWIVEALGPDTRPLRMEQNAFLERFELIGRVVPAQELEKGDVVLFGNDTRRTVVYAVPSTIDPVHLIGFEESGDQIAKDPGDTLVVAVAA